jgi:hypothetical protein
VTVALSVFEALDKAVATGGNNLSGKDIAGTGKAATALLAELCSSRLLEKTGGKSAKYSITTEGRTAWEREASEERRRQIKETEQRQQREAIVQFLNLVEERQKQNKPLSTKDLTRVPAPVIQDARERKLVEPGSKANSYRLLLAGEELLLGEKPLDQQLQRLREIQHQTTKHWRAAQQRLRQEIDALAGQGSDAMCAATIGLQERAQQAGQDFDNALAELEKLPALLAAARQLRNVTAGCQDALQRLETERSQLAALQTRLQQAAEQQQEQLHAFERRVGDRLDELAHRLKTVAKPTGEAASRPAGSVSAPPMEAAWEMTRRAHEQLRQEASRIGGIVKIPELTDAVLRGVNGLSTAAFHDFLRQWQQQDRLTLQLCNDPRLEPRAAEGIHSSCGLLFYVQMR